MAVFAHRSDHHLRLQPSGPWYWASRAAMVVLAAVLILSGGLKALDLNLFVRQIQSYGLITQPQLTALIAWAIITLEILLGAALLVNYQPRPVLDLTLALLVAFTLLTLYAAIRGGVEDCGCFGALVKRTPMQAAVEDGVLVCICLIARRGAAATPPKGAAWRATAVGAAALFAAVLPFFTGVPSALQTKGSPQSGEIWTTLQVEGVADLDLGAGTHLVVLMSAGCQHCQDAVPEIAMLMDALPPDGPSVVGLGQDNAEDLQVFADEWAPPYPIGRIDSGAFWSLLAEAELPRILLVRAGRTLAVWDGRVPTVDEVGRWLSQ